MADTIEIVTIRLREGVSDEAFLAENRKMESEYLSKLQGFLTRDTARADDGSYVVILHWERPEDAQASMDRFEAEPKTQDFTALLDMSTFKMTRYTQVDRFN